MSLFGTKTIYFIDSENVNDNWIENITEFKKSDEIRVFYTEKSTNVSWENISKIAGGDVSLNWIKCFTGQNALDFQLVTDLGYSVAKGTRDTFVIISNDKGYDAVVNYWVIKGVDVKRIGVETKAPKKTRRGVRVGSKATAPFKANATSKSNTASKPRAVKKVSASSKKTKDDNVTKSADKRAEKRTDERLKSVFDSAPKNSEEYAKAVARCIKVRDLNHYHMVLTNLLGQDMGTEYYHKLKDDKELKAKLSKTYITQKMLRLDYIVRLFLSYNNMDFDNTDDIIKIIRSKKCDSLNSFYRLLTERFKEEQGRTYYNIYKGIYLVLKDI